jgi:hypothetical protein
MLVVAQRRSRVPGERMPCAPPDEGLAAAVRALFVPVDRPPKVVSRAGRGGVGFMRSLRAIIGAEFVERFRVTGWWEFWLDKNGRSAGKPVNRAATRVGRGFGGGTSRRGFRPGPVSFPLNTTVEDQSADQPAIRQTRWPEVPSEEPGI